MGLEAATYLNDLVATNPLGTDGKAQGDDHLRLLKAVLQATLPGLAGRAFRTQQKGSNYDLVATDNMTFIECTAALTLGSSVAIGTLGNGFMVVVFANGGDVTFDPNGTETINNASDTTKVIARGEYAILFAGASRWSVLTVTGRGLKLVTGNTTLTAADANKTIYVNNDAVLTLPATSALSLGDKIKVKSITAKSVTLVRQGSDTIDDGATTSLRVGAYDTAELTYVASGQFFVTVRPEVVGGILWRGSASAQLGYVAADGAALSQTTYSGLFAEIGTTFGNPGGGNFNVPDLRGRTNVGSGTGTVVEAVTTSSGNGFDVASNNFKWITGMPVVLSNLTGFTTSATAGPTYYVVRISSTNIRLATTLNLAQNIAPNVTISGTGTCTITHTMTARTLGEAGGEETHAQADIEVGPHTHTTPQGLSGGGAFTFPGGGSGTSTTSGSLTAGNAMNNMQPSLVLTPFIKA